MIRPVRKLSFSHAVQHRQFHHHTTTVSRPFFRDHPGEPVPEENFWTLWCKGRLTEADTLTIRLGAIPSGLTSAHFHHSPHMFLQAGCPSCRPTNIVKALKATQRRQFTGCILFGAQKRLCQKHTPNFTKPLM